LNFRNLEQHSSLLLKYCIRSMIFKIIYISQGLGGEYKPFAACFKPNP
jgi:hypothetical protein